MKTKVKEIVQAYSVCRDQYRVLVTQSERLTRYTGRRWRRGMVRAKIVALTKPQQVKPKLMMFLVRLSVTPTLSRMGDKK